MVQISGEIALGIFLNGLKPAIQHRVRSFMPASVNQAYTLVVLQEISLRNLQQEFNSNSRRPPLLPTPRTQHMNSSSTLKPTPKPFADSKGKAIINFDDRRSKGLCFLCDENYVKGHKCKKK